MSQLEVDASNASIPIISPLVGLYPVLPSTTRGEVCMLDGSCGRLNQPRLLLVYGNGRLVVVRELFLKKEDEEKNKVKALVYRGHMAQVTCAKFSPSGAYIASADVRGNLRVWSYDNEEHLCKLNLARALSGAIRDIGWDEDSRRICIVGDTSVTEPCCRLIRWNTGVTCGELGKHVKSRVQSCSVQHSTKQKGYNYFCIATGGGEDHAIILNDNAPRTSEVTTVHSRGAVHCVRFSHDGERIASVGADKSLCFWSVGGNKDLVLEKKIENAHDASIYSCDFNSDDSLVITCSADGSAKLWDTETGTNTRIYSVLAQQSSLQADTTLYKKLYGGMQVGCAFIQNNAVSVGYNGKIAVLPNDLQQDTDVTFVSGHQSPIATMAMHTGALSSTLFTGDTDGIICCWDLNTGQCNRIPSPHEDDHLLYKVHLGTITSMVYVPDTENANGSGTLITSGWDDTIRMCTSSSSDDQFLHSNSIKLEYQPNALALGSKLVALMTVGGIVLLKDGQIVSQDTTIPLPYEAISISVSNNDELLCIGGKNCNIYIYTIVKLQDQLYTIQESTTLKSGHLRPVHAVQFSPDSTKLASADSRDVCIWDAANDFQPIISKNRWCFHTLQITSLAWSPDSQLLASAGLDDSLYIWSLQKKLKRIHYPFCHRGGITGLRFWKERLLVSTGNDGCVCQWDVSKDITAKFGL